MAVPVDIDQYLSGGVLPVETTKERLKMLQGPDKKNSGNIILVLKTIGNEQSMTGPLEGYYFKDGDQVKLFQKKVYEWIIYAREKLYADYWLPDSIINMSPTALYDWVSNLTPDNAPSWLPKWAVNMVPHAHTVHGSLSTYESNTLFMVFYPYLNDHPSMRDDFKADLRAFLDDYTPEKTDLGGETPRFTTNHPDVFVHSIKNSNEIFMEQSTDGQ